LQFAARCIILILSDASDVVSSVNALLYNAWLSDCNGTGRNGKKLNSTV
jgi:hypothetical protein